MSFSKLSTQCLQNRLKYDSIRGEETHRWQTNMDRRAARWWMMIARPSHRHPSPLLDVDSSADPLDSLSGRHVQVTKHPEGPAPSSQPAPLDHYHGSPLKGHPTRDSLRFEGPMQVIVWTSFDDCTKRVHYSFSMDQTNLFLQLLSSGSFSLSEISLELSSTT